MKIDKRFLLLVPIAALLYTANIWGYSIYILDEAKNATCASEMYDYSNYIVPYFNAELRTDKPPLHYYFMSLAYAAFGTNEFAARLFSGIFGLLTLIITYFATLRLLDKDSAFYAALVLAASLQLVVQFHLAVPDPYLIFFVSATLFSFLLYDQGHGKKWLWLFYGAIALAVLSKGPVAIVLPGVIVLAYLFFSSKLSWKNVFAILDLRGIALFLVLALPWYLAVHFQTDGLWTDRFFFKHNLQRFTGRMEGHGGFFLLPLILILTGTLPFSVFAPQAFVHAWKDRDKSLILLAFLTVATFAIFFAISRTKLPSYTSPCLPFMAILLGYYFKKATEQETKLKKHLISFLIFGVIVLAFPLGIYFGLPHEKSLAHLSYLGIYFIPMAVAGIVSLIFAFRGKIYNSFLIMGLSFMIGSLTFFYVAFPKVDQLNPVAEALETFDYHEKILAYKSFNPSFCFYIHKPIPRIREFDGLMKELKNGKENTILLTYERHWKEIKAAIGEEGFELLHIKNNLFENKKSMVFRVNRAELK